MNKKYVPFVWNLLMMRIVSVMEHTVLIDTIHNVLLDGLLHPD